jgi:glycosyltransferase involved in cell wall biosynthesis
MIKTSPRRLNILITAHEISPVVGSECSSGWNILTRLGKFHDITVLYAETNQFGTNNYREQIESYITANGIVSGVEFIAIKQPPITNLIARINKSLSDKRTSVGLSLLYFSGVKFWEKSLYRFTIKLLKERNYDVVHHFNHISFREPGFLWKIDKPFVWGPTSGLSRVPVSFLHSMPMREVLYNLLRNFLNRFQSIINRRISRAINNSDIIYFVTSDDGKFFLKKGNRAQNLLDMGAYEVSLRKERMPNEITIKVLWIGRFSFLKALDILLKAIESSVILKKKIELHVIGDGPQKDYYQKMASDLDLENITWHGHIPKDVVFKIMKESDVLVHTSIKEAASAVILESISAGLPIICHDSFGMSFAINESCGIKVPFFSPKESITGFKEALEKICNNPELVNQLSKGAIKRAKELSWDSVAEKIASDYYSIVRNKAIEN